MSTRPPVSWSRARSGRRMAGVCAGLPEIAGLGTRRLRLLFCVAALLGGIGIIIYAACWLVLPKEYGDAETDAARGVVMLAWGTGAVLMTVALVAFGTVAAMLGLGWLVFAVACIPALVILIVRTRPIATAASLCACAALTLPATAVSLGSARIPFAPGHSVTAPATASALTHTVFRTSLAGRLIDLRHTRLPRRGIVEMRIEGGIRRTIVALPARQCIHVTVSYDVHPFAQQLEALLTGYHPPHAHGVVLFGRVFDSPHGFAANPDGSPGLTLVIHFRSLGGNLIVRDYDKTVSPETNPGWPGSHPYLRPRPNVHGKTPREAKALLADWRTGQASILESYEEAVEGPCL